MEENKPLVMKQFKKEDQGKSLLLEFFGFFGRADYAEYNALEKFSIRSSSKFVPLLIDALENQITSLVMETSEFVKRK